MAEALFDKALPESLLKADNLPSMPAVAVEVLRLTQDENASIDDLARTLARDPALAAKLLKLSNSSLFSMGQEITTLQRATMVLGMKTVKLMSLSFSLSGALPRAGSAGGFDFREFWRRSLVSAVAGRSLARLVKSRDGDEAFLCGLLGHFGKLVLAQCMAEEYEDVVHEALGWPSLTIEERCLGFSSADVGAALLKSWQLPSVVWMTVGFMHRPSELPAVVDAAVRKLVELMHVAASVEAILCDEDKARHLSYMHTLCLQRFGLSESEVDAFLVGLESGIKETAEMLSIQLEPGQSYQALIDQARMQMVQVSLGTAVDLAQEQRKSQQLESQNRALAVSAETDKLTGLPNRATLDAFLSHEVGARIGGRVPRALGLIMIDVDKFKNFNDTYGHQAGDEVLRMVGSVLNKLTRKGDMAARYGGEEFAMIVSQTTPFGLKTMADRLRIAIAEQVLDWEGHRLSVTASFGCACLAVAESEGDARALIKVADHFLYKAKENGRNRCEVYSKVQLPAH
jgi:diguanylate cyclase (GGDEF)-like protein